MRTALVRPSPLRLPISTPVSEARVALTSTGQAIAIVTNAGVDVGVVTAEELAADGSMPTVAIGDVMGREVVRIDPRTDLRWTLRTYRKAAWASAIRRRPGQPQTAAAVCDSAHRSALMLAAEVLDAHAEAEQERTA